MIATCMYLVDEGAEVQPLGGGVAHDHLLEGRQQQVLVLLRPLEGVQDAGEVPIVRLFRTGRVRSVPEEFVPYRKRRPQPAAIQPSDEQKTKGGEASKAEKKGAT